MLAGFTGTAILGEMHAFRARDPRVDDIGEGMSPLQVIFPNIITPVKYYSVIFFDHFSNHSLFFVLVVWLLNLNICDESYHFFAFPSLFFLYLFFRLPWTRPPISWMLSHLVSQNFTELDFYSVRIPQSQNFT